MKTLLIVLALLGQTNGKTITISSTDTGVEDDNLADTPTTLAINMEEGRSTNQLSLSLVVTEGSTTRLDVRCYQSQSSTSGWAPIPLCDSASPSACAPDVRRFTLSAYTAVSGVKHITSQWVVTKQFVKCSADDPDDSDGTVTITGARSWR